MKYSENILFSGIDENDCRRMIECFNAKIVEGIPKKLEHVDLRMIKPDEICNYEFCVSSKPILKKLKNMLFIL